MAFTSRQHLKTTSYSYVVVVCTKNRPKQILEFIDILNGQVSDKLKEVIVVDGSNPQNQLISQAVAGNGSPGSFDWKVLTTSHGKPSALNVAMEYLELKEKSFDAVVFLDDDINFALHEIEKGIRYLFENKLSGLSPLVINENDVCKIGESRRSFSEVFQKEGKVTKAGENRWINQHNLKKSWVETDWLPGGASIYEWKSIKELRFSPGLENPSLNGYALGDDVDFSLRAQTFGKIGCLTTIQVIHSSPETATREFVKIVKARGRWKAFLLQQFPSRISLRRIIILEAIRSCWHLVSNNKYPGGRHEFFIFLKEFLTHLD